LNSFEGGGISSPKGATPFNGKQRDKIDVVFS